jgi:hypothetical protein
MTIRKLKVIGISGKQNSGKDTLAETFIKHGFVRISYGDAVKDATARIFKIPEYVLWGPSENRDPTTRKILQELGTDFARKFDPHVWVKRVNDRIDALRNGQTDPLKRCFAPTHGCLKVVVPDIRFPNEARDLKEKYNATLIRITRPDQHIGKDPESCTHASETNVDKIPSELFDINLDNRGTLLDLYKTAEKTAKELDD